MIQHLLLSSCLAVLALVSPAAGWLGVYLADEGGKATIDEVIPASPAAQAGLRAGDRIVRVAGQDTADVAAVVAALRGTKPGQKVTLVYERRGERRKVEVTLGTNPEAAAEPPRADPDQRTGRTEAPETSGPFLGLALAQQDQGVVVDETLQGGPANGAGLRPGDRLLAVGDRRLRSLEDMTAALRGVRPGQKLRLQVVRGDQRMAVDVVVGARPAPAPGGEKAPKAKDAPKAEEAPGAKPEGKDAPEAKLAPEGRKGPAAKVAPEAKAAPALRWQGLADAERAARADGKPVVVVFGASWCATCKALQRSFEEPAVRDAARGVHLAWVDTEREGALADRAGVGEIPHLEVRTSAGERVVKKVGYQAPSELARLLAAHGKAGDAPKSPPAARDADRGAVAAAREAELEAARRSAVEAARQAQAEVARARARAEAERERALKAADRARREALEQAEQARQQSRPRAVRSGGGSRVGADQADLREVQQETRRALAELQREMLQVREELQKMRAELQRARAELKGMKQKLGDGGRG